MKRVAANLTIGSLLLSVVSVAGAEELIGWMKEKINQRDVNAIFRYEVDGKTYYGLSILGKDVMYPLYDAAGNYVCSPSGGLTGRGDGKCPELRMKIQQQEQVKIWEKLESRKSRSQENE